MTSAVTTSNNTCPLRVYLSVTSEQLLRPAVDFIQGITGVDADLKIVPPDEIAQVAHRSQRGRPELIVLADGGATPRGQGDGIDTAEIAMDSPVPVMNLRASTDTSVVFPAFNRILVPLDGSARAADALPLATHMAKGARVPVHLVMVIDPSRVIPPAFAYDPDAWSVISELRETAHWALRQAEQPMMREGIEVESSLLYGPVNACLQAEIRATDMVVMTTHGSGKARSRLGSVAARVLASAAGPVVIHRGSDQGDVVVDGYEACSWVEPLSRRTGTMRR